MKSIKIFSFLIMAGLLTFSIGCTKSSDTTASGAATVAGKITYQKGGSTDLTPAAYANVYVFYGTLVAGTNPDQILKTDSAGNFSLKLTTGNYYFSADYTDGNGFVYKSYLGVSAAINNSSDKVTVNMTVK